MLCDVFAAECLVPWHLIQPLTGDRDFFSEHGDGAFGPVRSLEALRGVQVRVCIGAPIAYVVVEGGVIRYCVSSRRASREAGIFLRTGVQLPGGSAAARAIRKESAMEVADMEASDWSHGNAADRFSVHEEVIYQPAWGRYHC